jgi:hypothetical protein
LLEAGLFSCDFDVPLEDCILKFDCILKLKSLCGISAVFRIFEYIIIILKRIL